MVAKASAVEDARATRRIYAKPPVLEALVNIHVAPMADDAIPRLQAFTAGEESRYPNVTTMMSTAVHVDTPTGLQTSFQQHLTGFRISNTESTEIIQARKDGFAFSRLRPYTDWGTWYPEAQRLWRGYLDVVQPETVMRITVRYVNRIDIPSPNRELREFLTIRPEVPVALPRLITGYLMRLDMPQADMDRTVLVLSQGRVTPPEAGIVSVLLDLDLSSEVELDASSPEVWDALQELHQRENEIFEQCITDEARRLFQ